MNDYTRLHLQAETHKKQYPPGTRIYLERMNDQYDPVPSGTRGTVHHVDDMDNIHMRWDNHRTLPLSPDVDSFRTLTAAELNEELRRDHEIVSLGDDCEIVLPEKPIDCSELTYFDELNTNVGISWKNTVSEWGSGFWTTMTARSQSALMSPRISKRSFSTIFRVRESS